MFAFCKTSFFPLVLSLAETRIEPVAFVFTMPPSSQIPPNFQICLVGGMGMGPGGVRVGLLRDQKFDLS